MSPQSSHKRAFATTLSSANIKQTKKRHAHSTGVFSSILSSPYWPVTRISRALRNTHARFSSTYRTGRISRCVDGCIVLRYVYVCLCVCVVLRHRPASRRRRHSPMYPRPDCTHKHSGHTHAPAPAQFVCADSTRGKSCATLHCLPDGLRTEAFALGSTLLTHWRCGRR